MATLRDLQKQQTRRLLLDTGLAIFQEKGYATTTIDDIAAAAGTTRTTFYLHFKSKAALIKELIAEVGAILTAVDDPPLTAVVESGDRALIRRWLDRKFDQWEKIRPYIVVAHQAASNEPEVAATIEAWFDTTIARIQAGLDAADRFDRSSRHVRSTLAFGQFEFLSQRWFTRGWNNDREISLETLTDSWCFLLARQ